MLKKQKQKVVKVKAWAVMGKKLPLIAHKSYRKGGMEFCIYRAKYSAEDNCIKEANQRIIPVEIHYKLSLPSPKKE
mgnify:CR=1 FL=1